MDIVGHFVGYCISTLRDVDDNAEVRTDTVHSGYDDKAIYFAMFAILKRLAI